MNSWKLNGQAGHLTRQAIIKELKMKPSSLYRAVKSIDNNGIITVYNNRKYEVVLKEVK